MTEPLTLVHTMGRVGSTSAFRALEKAGLDALHIHHLDRRTLRRMPRSRHVSDGRRAARTVRWDRRRPVDVVTLVRDPVDRNVSAAFARFRKLGDGAELAGVLADRDAVDHCWTGVDTDLPRRWFDEEVRGPTGIDAFSVPFPPEGVARFDVGRFRLLVMSSSLDAAAQTRALGTFVGREVRVRRNDSATRSGGGLHEVYARFARTCPWSRDEVVAMLDTPYARHFVGPVTDERVARALERLEIER